MKRLPTDALSMAFFALLAAFAAGRALDNRVGTTSLRRAGLVGWRTVVTACGALGLAAPALLLFAFVLASLATGLTGVANVLF